MKNRVIPYETLSAEQHRQLVQIELTPEQRSQSGDIHGALHALTARCSADLQGYTLLVDDVPRGFFLLKRRSMLPPWAEGKTATLHGLMIDRDVQGQGLGRVCMAALPDLVANLWPEVERLMLAVHPDNVAAQVLYQTSGWVFSGDASVTVDGTERPMVLHVR
jgi:GNAT superfamily N-acetyltransferase